MSPSCPTGRRPSGAVTSPWVLSGLGAPAAQDHVELFTRGVPVLGGCGHVDRVLDAVPGEVRLLDGAALSRELRLLRQRGPGEVPQGAAAVPERLLLEAHPVVVLELGQLLLQVLLVAVRVL